MRRIKLIVAYDGTEYSGWQIQPEAPTIEMYLDKAIHELTGENVHVTGASRTDAGVHAYGNVAVFDTESTIPGDRFTFALNRFLPDSIVIQDSWEVSVDFHPRHCDTRKTYEYRILNTAVPLPQKRNFTWHVAGRTFTPHIDTGDYIVVVNADKIKVTGKKMDQKVYYHHSDYVGGMKEQTLKEKMAKKPEDVIYLAVKGMLPKGPLGRQMIKKLYVYAGPEHKQQAQKPEVLEIKY